MTDLTDHPFVVLCDRAMCSPDIRHIRGESFQWLADRINTMTGESWTADQIRDLEDSWSDCWRLAMGDSEDEPAGVDPVSERLNLPGVHMFGNDPGTLPTVIALDSHPEGRYVLRDGVYVWETVD